MIAKSSTLAFSKPFFNQGLLNRRAVLKSSYAQFLFLMSGADHDQMDRMRSYVTSMCAGWDVEQVKSIVNETLHDVVDPLVFAEAAELIADHKLCGRDVVVVSASGEEIVAPIARGRSHARDGDPDGRRGRPLHRRGGVLLLRRGQGRGDPRVGGARGYALEHCYAYSDSITDLAMLETVGHPTVVNPDRALRKEAAARGWPVQTFSRPVPLRDRLPAPSGAAMATTAAAGTERAGGRRADVLAHPLAASALVRLTIRPRPKRCRQTLDVTPVTEYKGTYGRPVRPS